MNREKKILEARYGKMIAYLEKIAFSGIAGSQIKKDKSISNKNYSVSKNWLR